MMIDRLRSSTQRSNTDSFAHRDTNGPRPWLWLLLFWVAATAYNLFKPFHIDDAAHLVIATWIVQHPLHPMSGILNWSGADEAIARTNQPHLYFYLIAIWGRFFGFSEPSLHVLQAGFTAAAILLMYRLARYLVPNVAIWATALVVLGPAFFVEQNLMVDVPLLAVWLGFFNVVILGIESPYQGRRWFLAAALCAVALLIKYSSLTLFPILCLAIAHERRWRYAWVLLIPIATLAAWSAFNVYDYGHIHILNRDTSAPHDRLRPAHHLIAWILGLGALTPLGVVFAMARVRLTARTERLIYIVIASSFLVLVLACAGRILPDAVSDKLLWTGFIANGSLIGLGLIHAMGPYRRLASLLASRTAQNDRALYLAIWIGVTTLFYVLFAPFMAARHILLILPAVTLLILMQSEEPRRSARVFALVMTVAITAGLSLADWNFASFYKREAVALASDSPKQGRKWTTGHWGWQWYAQAAGFSELDIAASPLSENDTVVVTKDTPNPDLKRRASLTLLKVDEENNQGLNPFCTGRPSSFYLYNYLTPPWSLSRHCGGTVRVYTVASVPGPAQTPPPPSP